MAIIISGFGDENVNGTYNEIKNHDGYPFYRKTTNDYVIIYKLENGPYSFAPAYWIEKVSNLLGDANGPVPIFTAKYKTIDTNVLTATWTSVGDTTSGELTIGTITDESSSSSSRDSSSSSSSELYSESSSSSSSSSSVDSSSSSSSELYSESSSSESVQEQADGEFYLDVKVSWGDADETKTIWDKVFSNGETIQFTDNVGYEINGSTEKWQWHTSSNSKEIRLIRSSGGADLKVKDATYGASTTFSDGFSILKTNKGGSTTDLVGINDSTGLAPASELGLTTTGNNRLKSGYFGSITLLNGVVIKWSKGGLTPSE